MPNTELNVTAHVSTQAANRPLSNGTLVGTNEMFDGAVTLVNGFLDDPRHVVNVPGARFCGAVQSRQTRHKLHR